MWSTTLANLKENLNKIALDVHEYDDDDEDEDGDDVSPRISHSRDSYSSSDRRFSHNSAISSLPIVNGFDSASNPEIEEYKAEIKRLQESEAQIKALSVNYAALLKEKEEWISQLNEENSTLKQNLGATYAALDASKSENLKTPTSSPTATRGGDQSPNRQHKSMMKTSSFGKRSQNGVVTKENASMNGTEHYTNAAALKDKIAPRHSSIEGNEKELADLLEEKNRSLAALQAKHEEQIRQLREELERERGILASVQYRLQEEQKLYRSFQEEHNSLMVDNDKMLLEMNKAKEELSKRVSEIRHLQMELTKKNNTEADGAVDSLKRIVAALEKENNTLKTEKDELKSALEAVKTSSQNILSSSANELSGSFPGKEEMELSLQKLEKDLKEVSRDRDKALNELNRLKQHLLDKESEESEKMDEDSKIIEELRENNEYLRAQIRNLEKSLRLAVAGQEEIKMINNNELQKSKEVIDVLNKKLASLTSTLDAKNDELLNLQTALGQYYAEIEVKERVDGDLALAREEFTRLSELLKVAYQQVEISKREQENCVTKLSQAERMIADGKGRINKLEEDNGKLRRALEQSMTRLNIMSMDSDYSVDRRIVIKLLVTYFQKNHSKEVLDLMVRMLGFSEEDKQRIGLAQQGAGKGVVRGMFGLPGRLVGGILGGSPAGSPSNVPSDNQSFADMWVDFLLKETEERERRESAKTMNGSMDNQHEGKGYSQNTDASQLVDRRFSSPPLSQYQSPSSSRGDFSRPEHSDSEFSTVPLASSDNSRHPKPNPRY